MAAVSLINIQSLKKNLHLDCFDIFNSFEYFILKNVTYVTCTDNVDFYKKAFPHFVSEPVMPE